MLIKIAEGKLPLPSIPIKYSTPFNDSYVIVFRLCRKKKIALIKEERDIEYFPVLLCAIIFRYVKWPIQQMDFRIIDCYCQFENMFSVLPFPFWILFSLIYAILN
jgi:hypothetical protein